MNKANDKEVFEQFANTCLKLKTQESDCTLRLADLLDEAKQKLKKKQWKNFLSDSRVNLKPTQARKLIIASQFCKDGVQPTELFQREGIEKTFIVASIENEELKKEMSEFLLKQSLSSRDLKKLIKLIESENLTVSKAFDKLQELKKQPREKKTKKTVSIAEFNKVLQKLEDIQKRLETSEKELMEYKRKSIKTDSLKTTHKDEKEESDHVQHSLL